MVGFLGLKSKDGENHSHSAFRLKYRHIFVTQKHGYSASRRVSVCELCARIRREQISDGIQYISSAIYFFNVISPILKILFTSCE